MVWEARNEMASTLRSTLFSIFLLSVIQFSYLYGSRDVYDSINWTSWVNNNSMETTDKKKHNATHTNGPRKNNFISLHSCSLHTYMFAGSGIWTSDSHKYTKNVCMTGHNIKYHQNRRRTKWKSCMMGVGFPTPFYCPTPGSLAHSLASYVCPFSHPSTLYFSTSSNRKFLEKEFHVRQKGKFVELKLVSGSGRW